MEKEIRWNTALYIRLSREDGDKEESDSVANQRRLLTEYIKGQKELVFYDIYVDDGFSGTNFNRPGFKKMMRDAEEGRVNCVIVKDLSRFGRDYIDTGRYLERIFPEYGIRFISLSDGIDSKKQSYDLLLPIKNVFNEQYARDISRKVHTAVRTKQRAGEFIGAFSSYGYRKAPGDKNKLLIDEYAAKVVRSIFEMYIKGYGKQRIAKELNQKGIPCPSEYKRLNGEHYKNCNRLEQTSYWTYSTINSILHKELYTGKMVQGTRRQHMRGRQKKVEKENWIVVENTHEPIIDKDTWDKAQSLLERRTRTVSMENDQNIFAGFVKCGDCGRAMTKNTWTGKDGKRRRTLYCGTYKRNGMHFCTPHAVPLALLEDIVLEDFNQLLKTMPSLEMLVRESIPEKRGRSGCGKSLPGFGRNCFGFGRKKERCMRIIRTG